MTSPVVMPMTLADLDDVMFLERQCFKDPWTRRMYLSDLTTNELAAYLVLRLAQGGASGVLAYGGFWMIAGEAHIATIASHPDWRRCGLGQWLLLAMLDEAIRRGAACSTLEVRAGNEPARRLYEKLGYEVVGERSHYYRDGENALIMTTPPLADPVMQERLAAVRREAFQRLEICFLRTIAR